MTAKKRKKKKAKQQPDDIDQLVEDEGDVCSKCGGYGFVVNDDSTAVPCECRSGYLLTQRLEAARIPPKFASKSVANFKARDKARKELLNLAAEFREHFGKEKNQHQGILMVGTTGSGKTHLAIAILREIIAMGYTGLYYNVPELLNDLRKTYSRDSDELEDDIMREACAVDVLVMDDLGAERTSGWVRDRLYLIINRRYERLKPTIVTTNFGTDDLKAQVGERIVSRLREMCPTVFAFPAEDFRLQFLDEQAKRQRKGR